MTICPRNGGVHVPATFSSSRNTGGIVCAGAAWLSLPEAMTVASGCAKGVAVMSGTSRRTERTGAGSCRPQLRAFSRRHIDLQRVAGALCPACRSAAA
ncbi:putative leader peptide [Streptantibioticus silvisoli]|uniref:putative leader peptide n=1 Tax=Streptantibioticus silvisoli TaxID=2705255 RepID=UPI00355654CA